MAKPGSGFHSPRRMITSGNVIALSNVVRTTVLVTRPGLTINSVAMIVVMTAVGMLASIIAVDLLNPCKPTNLAIRTAINGATSKRRNEAGTASQTLPSPFISAICIPKTISITGIAPEPANSMPRIIGPGIDIEKVKTIMANRTA